jgi:cell division FtsZ-interacting protein ZapD
VTVSTEHNTTLERIAQLQTQIEDTILERRRIQVELIAELDKQGHSLRSIGTIVGLPHVNVMHLLNGYKAARAEGKGGAA